MPSPQAQTIIAEMLAQTPGPTASLLEERQGWENWVRGQKLPEGTLVSGVSLNGVPCEWVERGDGDSQVILLVHGGGYNSGSPRTHRKLAALLALATGARVLVPEYALAPEEPFPLGLDDIVAVYAALHQLAPALEITFCGDSAGGGLALAAALKLRDIGAPLPGALMLLSPWVDLTLSGQHPADALPDISVAELRKAAAMYAPADMHSDPLVSPLFADLSGLPPILVQVGGRELLLDDAARLVERAKAAGVAARLSVAEGLWHVHQLSDCPEARDAVEEIAGFVRRSTIVETA